MGLMDSLFGSSGSAPKMPYKAENLINKTADAAGYAVDDIRQLYKDQADDPFQSYGGPEVAGFDGAEQRGLDQSIATGEFAGNMQGLLQDQAGRDYTLAGNTDLIDKLSNPFNQSVIDTTLSDMDRKAKQDQMDLDAAMVSGGAFGGSQAGVAQGVAMGEALRARAATEAQLRKDGYDTAAGLAQGDLNRQMQQFQTTSSATTAGTQAGTDAATTQGTLGAQRRAVSQARIDADKANWQAEQDWPWAKIQRYQDALAGGNNTMSTTSAARTGGSSASPGIVSQAAGLGMTGLALFCDDRIKTDAKRVGTLTNGAGLYTFRYLWDEPGIERLGPIAQEVLEVQPEAVAADPASGYLTVLPDVLDW